MQCYATCYPLVDEVATGILVINAFVLVHPLQILCSLYTPCPSLIVTKLGTIPFLDPTLDDVFVAEKRHVRHITCVEYRSSTSTNLENSIFYFAFKVQHRKLEITSISYFVFSTWERALSRVDEEIVRNWKNETLPPSSVNMRRATYSKQTKQGFFYRMLPNRTLACKGQECRAKLNKDRLTVMLCTNMDGNKK